MTVDGNTPEQLAKLCQVVVGRFSGLFDPHLGLARTYRRQDSSIRDSVHGYKLFCSLLCIDDFNFCGVLNLCKVLHYRA